MEEYEADELAAEVYAALPTAKSIRLLRILPGEIGDTIECTLSAVDLGDAPRYYSLSYCWGATEPQLPIICNRHAIDVRSNIVAALRRLRSLNEEVRQAATSDDD